MEVCYTTLANLRACDICKHDNLAYVKYLTTYASREKNLSTLLYYLYTKDEIDYYQEYYTGSVIVVLSHPEKTYVTLKCDLENEKILKSVPTLVVATSDIKPIDDEFIKNFYLNDELNRIDDIIKHIEYLEKKTENNIKDYIKSIERIASFKCYEEAYYENAKYDLKRGITYKMKKKIIDNQ